MNFSRREFLGYTSWFGLGALAGSELELFAGGIAFDEKKDRERNPYLYSVFAPVETESTILDLKIAAGKLPDDIEGSYIRNGPNPIFRTDPHHWFDGNGMLHEVRIGGGFASYRNRFIRTQAFMREQTAKRKLYAGIQELMHLKHFRTVLWDAIFDHSPVKDTSHTDLIYFQKKLITLFWLSGIPYEIDPKDLNTKGPFLIQGYSRRHISAHARVDEATGDLFCLDFSKMALSVSQRWSYAWVNVVCIGKNGAVKWDEHFPLPNNRIFHDIMFTENYVILMDFPVGLDIYKKELSLFPKIDARIVLISRNDPKTHYEFFMPTTVAPYVLHSMNAYDENGVVKMIVCKYRTDPFGKDKKDASGKVIPFVGPLRVETRSALWVLDIAKKTWKQEFEFADNTEFPRVNDRWIGRLGSKYSYHPVVKESEVMHFDGLIKYNWKDQKQEKRIDFSRAKRKRVCEEFVFIPKKTSKNSAEPCEDDGYLGSMIHTFETEADIKSHFEIYCAKNLDLVASIEAPRVPVGFHSKWIPDLVDIQGWSA